MNSSDSEQLCLACGGRYPLHLVVESPDRVALFILDQPFALVGAFPSADVYVTCGGVADRQAYLQVVDGRLLCVDLTVTHGHERRSEWVWQGGTFETGPLRIRWQGEYDTPAAMTAWPEALQSSDSPPAVVEIASGNGSVARWRMDRPLALVGRSSTCKVRLRHASVSRFHCALVATRSGVWAVDLLGRGGIAFNDQLARFGHLGVGDILRIGKFTMRVCPQAQGEALSLAPTSAPSAAMPPARLDPSVAAMMAQFAMMQRELIEQFRLTMATVIRTASEGNRELIREIRCELLRAKQLSSELDDLRTTPAAHRPAMPPTPTVSPRDRSAVRPERREQPSAKSPTSTESSPRPPRTPNEPPALSPPVAAGGQVPAEEVHAWLHQRVLDVQSEQVGCWERIRRLLTK